MEDKYNNKHNNPNEDFASYIRKEVTDFSGGPSDGVWAQLSERLAAATPDDDINTATPPSASAISIITTVKIIGSIIILSLMVALFYYIISLHENIAILENTIEQQSIQQQQLAQNLALKNTEFNTILKATKNHATANNTPIKIGREKEIITTQLKNNSYNKVEKNNGNIMPKTTKNKLNLLGNNTSDITQNNTAIASNTAVTKTVNSPIKKVPHLVVPPINSIKINSPSLLNSQSFKFNYLLLNPISFVPTETNEFHAPFNFFTKELPKNKKYNLANNATANLLKEAFSTNSPAITKLTKTAKNNVNFIIDNLNKTGALFFADSSLINNATASNKTLGKEDAELLNDKSTSSLHTETTNLSNKKNSEKDGSATIEKALGNNTNVSNSLLEKAVTNPTKNNRNITEASAGKSTASASQGQLNNQTDKLLNHSSSSTNTIGKSTIDKQDLTEEASISANSKLSLPSLSKELKNAYAAIARIDIKREQEKRFWLGATSETFTTDTEFDYQLNSGFNVGLESEFYLKKGFSLYTQLRFNVQNYQVKLNYNDDVNYAIINQYPTSSQSQSIAKIKTLSTYFDLPIGVKWKFPVDNKTQFFVNSAIGWQLYLPQKFTYSYKNGTSEAIKDYRYYAYLGTLHFGTGIQLKIASNLRYQLSFNWQRSLIPLGADNRSIRIIGIKNSILF